MSRIKDRKNCPFCGSLEQTDFFEVKSLPIHVCVFSDTSDEAFEAPTGDITLSFCHNCGFIHNRRYDPRRIRFEPGYEASLFNSGMFRSYLENLAARLIERYDIQGKSILEIGCGAGDFLRLLCGQGDNEGTGIDPTLKTEGTVRAGNGSVRFIRDYFSEKYGPQDFDFICCLSVFEDIPDPGPWLETLRRLIGEDRETILYFEVPNSDQYFRSDATWSLYYEQCSFFTRETLSGLFIQSGFDVIDAGTSYQEGQYVYVEAKPGPFPLDKKRRKVGNPEFPDLPAHLKSFSAHHMKNVKIWEERLSEFKRAGRKAVVWGTGGKGVGFLNTIETGSAISYAVDINPQKQGKYIPGSAQKIVPPEFLAEFKPHTVIITNPVYEKEIRKQANDFDLNCDFFSL